MPLRGTRAGPAQDLPAALPSPRKPCRPVRCSHPPLVLSSTFHSTAAARSPTLWLSRNVALAGSGPARVRCVAYYYGCMGATLPAKSDADRKGAQGLSAAGSRRRRSSGAQAPHWVAGAVAGCDRVPERGRSPAGSEHPPRALDGGFRVRAAPVLRGARGRVRRHRPADLLRRGSQRSLRCAGLVTFGVAGGHRDRYLPWDEGKVPDFVLEVASPATARRDATKKKAIYEGMGVREYWLYDSRGGLHWPRLQAFELGAAGYAPRKASEPLGGPLSIRSSVLGFELRFDGEDLRLWDPATGEYLLRIDEAEARAQEHGRFFFGLSIVDPVLREPVRLPERPAQRNEGRLAVRRSAAGTGARASGGRGGAPGRSAPDSAIAAGRRAGGPPPRSGSAPA